MNLLRSLPLMLGWVLSALPAQGGVTEPFTGVKWVRDGSSSLIVVNLCAPGVSLRSTRYRERKATAEGWAAKADVQAQVAINGDAFDSGGWTQVLGRARGGGEDWPPSTQLKERRMYWQFGPQVAALQPDSSVVPPLGITELIGGRNQLIVDGQSRGPTFDGDPLLEIGSQRTVVGLSQNKSTLFLFATHLFVDGDGAVNELKRLVTLAKAPEAWWATNMDGGNSSQMFVQGAGTVAGTASLVANHLGVIATGTGASPHCPTVAAPVSAEPRGYLDSATCGSVGGWAQDPDVPEQPIDVHIYGDGPPLQTPLWAHALRAATPRADLCDAVGSCNHGYNLRIPLALHDNQTHEVRAYGMNAQGGVNPELAGSPKSITCTGALPAGVRRLVSSDRVTAWKFDLFWQGKRPNAEQLAQRAVGRAWPLERRTIRGDDRSPEVYWVDGPVRRWITTRTAADLWKLDVDRAELLPTAELNAIPLGPPLRAEPVLAVFEDKVFVMDDATTDSPEAVPPLPGDPLETDEPPPNESTQLEGSCAQGGGGVLGGASLLVLLCLMRSRRMTKRAC